MNTNLRTCERCHASAGSGDDNCRQCGAALPHRSNEFLIPSVSWWKWFVGLDGRLNRGGFLLREVSALILLIGPMLIVLAISDGDSIGVFFSILYLAGILLGVGVHISALVRRFHDRDKSGDMMLLLFVPLLNLFIYIDLLAVQGQDHWNDYGNRPDGIGLGL